MPELEPLLALELKLSQQLELAPLPELPEPE
jgi:hypothetical protein